MQNYKKKLEKQFDKFYESKTARNLTVIIIAIPAIIAGATAIIKIYPTWLS